MKPLSTYIKESISDFKGWIKSFTFNYKSSANLRFLNPEKDKKLIEEFINANECNKTLYRASYIDHGYLWGTNEGDTCTEPVLSFTELENWVDSTNKAHAINDHITGNIGYIMKVILKKGSKSLNISQFSEFPEQKEWIACGKFKVLKKTTKQEVVNNDGKEIKFDLHIVEIEQVFDEDLFNIFKELYNISPNKKQEDYLKRINQEKQDMTEPEIIELINANNKKSISAAEIARWEKKGIKLTKEYLANVLAKRIYLNGIEYDYDKNKYNPLSYQMIYDIAKKHKIKIKGAKRCGYPELDFPETL